MDKNCICEKKDKEIERLTKKLDDYSTWLNQASEELKAFEKNLEMTKEELKSFKKQEIPETIEESIFNIDYTELYPEEYTRKKPKINCEFCNSPSYLICSDDQYSLYIFFSKKKFNNTKNKLNYFCCCVHENCLKKLTTIINDNYNFPITYQDANADFLPMKFENVEEFNAYEFDKRGYWNNCPSFDDAKKEFHYINAEKELYGEKPEDECDFCKIPLIINISRDEKRLFEKSYFRGIDLNGKEIEFIHCNNMKCMRRADVMIDFLYEISKNNQIE